MSEAPGVTVTLKWSKQIYKDQFYLEDGCTALGFKEQVRNVTGVPVERQKLLCKACWKGSLRDDHVFRTDTFSRQTSILVTLIGSADKLPEPPKEKAKFLEDLTPEELAAQEQGEKAAAMANCEGMIATLQFPPHLRDDNKTEMYQYNRLVTGLPQREIEGILRHRQVLCDSATASEELKNEKLVGKVVMTLGLELRRAYVNDLAVLPDGTLVSALDDGHIQMWQHGTLVQDIVHEGMANGGVDSLMSLGSMGKDLDIAFATGGRGSVRLWNGEGECRRTMSSPVGSSPSCLVAVNLLQDRICLAASFRITRHSDPGQFRLVPQDEAGRQRRAQAEAQEAAIHESLSRVSCCVQVWYNTRKGDPEFRSIVLEPEDITGAAPVTDLKVLYNGNNSDSGLLISGDSAGWLRCWRAQCNNEVVQWHCGNVFQLRPLDSAQTASIVCMESLPDGRLAVATTDGITGNQTVPELSDSHTISIPVVRAVLVLDLARGILTNVFNAHSDAVLCMCSLPNGCLVTGGGKYDATVKIWDKSQLRSEGAAQDESETAPTVVTNASNELKDVGYVFSMAVLPDEKPGSKHFALAAARYNVIKICL